MNIEDLQMLNWREEEEQYIEHQVELYLEEQRKMPLGFLMSYKTLGKECAKVREKAREEYRERKLMIYAALIEEERHRINKVVDEINSRFNNWLKKYDECISKNIKPFKIEVSEYKNYNEPLLIDSLEVVSIRPVEHFDVSFLQQKVLQCNKESIDSEEKQIEELGEE